MHERIWAVALFVGFVIGTAPASAADKAMPPITKKNWHNHPGSDDSGYLLEHHYDEKGRLRFAFGRTGAVNDTVVEHRLYYSEDGKLLWHDRKQQGIGYPFLTEWPEKDGIPGGLNHFVPSQYERPLLRSTSSRNSEKQLAICSQ